MKWAHESFDREGMALAHDTVSMDESWALIEHFSGLVRESGSEDERRGAEYIRQRLEALGLNPVVYEPELFLSVPRSSRLEVLGPDSAVLESKVPAFSNSTDAGGLEGELVEVATGSIKGTSDLFKAEASSDLSKVRGKIALAHGYAMPKIVGQLERAGAAAAIFINPGHAHEGIITSIWGTPGLGDRDRIPDIVVLSVPRAVGEELRRRMGNGACCVRVDTDLFQGWAPCPVVSVEIPGESDDFVLFHGHHDSWHVGIGDNAVGNAALVEVARVAGTMRERLRRGVRVVWWPGHSTGRYAGSTWYADEFAMELRDHCVAQIDVDSPGCRGATVYDEVMWMAESEELARQSIRAGAGAEARGIRPLRAGDYSFNQIGLTGFFMLLSNVPEAESRAHGYYPVGGCGGNSDAWHTEGDTLDVADRGNLERDIHVYVEALMRLGTSPFLPFDYRATAREIAETVASYAASAAGELDVTGLVTECEALVADLDRFYAAVESIATAAGTDEASNAAAWERLRQHDRIQMSLARDLVAVGYSTRRYYHDPALETPAVPDLSILRDWARFENDPDGQRFLLAQAKRGRNRVTDAVKRARERLVALTGEGA